MAQTAPPILRLTYNLNLHLQSRLMRFPKNQRLLSATLAEQTLSVLTLLAGANATREHERRIQSLNRAREHLAAMRICLRLSQDLRCLSQGEHAHLAAQVEDTARQLDGWIAYTQKVQNRGDRQDSLTKTTSKD